MDFGKVQYTLSMTEEELREAIEYYTLHKYQQKIKIQTLTHKTREWTEGYGMCERDLSEPDGVSFTCEGV